MPRRERRSPLAAVLVVAGASVAVAALVGAAWYLQRTSADLAPPSASAPAKPPPPPRAPPDPMDPLKALVDARRKAQAWHAEAILVSITATPVSAGKVASSGSIELEFAAPKGGKLGPGNEVLPERFVVVMSRREQKISVRRAAPTLGIADPNCPLDEAWRKMVASGVPSTTSVTMKYELHRKRDRAVWSTSVPGKPELSRTLDGNTCAIVSLAGR